MSETRHSEKRFSKGRVGVLLEKGKTLSLFERKRGRKQMRPDHFTRGGGTDVAQEGKGSHRRKELSREGKTIIP